MVTTLLEMVGLSLICAAVVVALWPVSAALGLGAAGVLLIVVSWLVSRR